MSDMKLFYVRLANRLGWLYRVEQSDIDWYWFKLMLKRLPSAPVDYFIRYMALNNPKGIFSYMVEVILGHKDLGTVEGIRKELELFRELMVDSLSLETARLAMLAATDVRLGYRSEAIERYVQIVSLNTQLEMKGERTFNIGSLTRAIFNESHRGVFDRRAVD